MRTALPEHHWSSRTVSELRTPCSSGLLCCGWSEPTGSVPPSREHGRGLPGWPRPPGQRWSRLSLATPKVDMCSKLGMDLKRTMLLRLARRDPKLHPDDPARREAIYNKYQEFAIPEEEAEWVGLSLEEAIEKQRLREKKDPVPLFKVYAEELVSQLKEQALQKQ
nr:PREDICTED: 39S ribosomal protein L28, mitochondrial [Opisthocomus hoazin]